MLALARRIVFALSLAGLIAALFRLRGTGGVPPQSGGWREITEVDLT
jgi:alpha-beta hydrolase superfamily lysophospholipase